MYHCWSEPVSRARCKGLALWNEYLLPFCLSHWGPALANNHWIEVFFFSSSREGGDSGQLNESQDSRSHLICGVAPFLASRNLRYWWTFTESAPDLHIDSGLVGCQTHASSLCPCYEKLLKLVLCGGISFHRFLVEPVFFSQDAGDQNLNQHLIKV